MTQIDFAESKNMSRHAFSYWYRKLKLNSQKSQSDDDFVQISLNTTSHPSSSIKIITKTGLILNIDKNFDNDLLRDILSAIGEIA